ncbi:MAG: hypothetical protein ACLQT7_07405 [Candidatus Dormibacteria bacterium]
MRCTGPLVLGVLAVVATAGCGIRAGAPGEAAPPATASPSPPAASASPSPGQVLGSASNAAGWTAVVTAQAGGRLQLSVTVTGPLTLLGGCIPTLTASARTVAGAPVPTPTPSPAASCLAIVLEAIPAGESRTFTAILAEPEPAGNYVIVGTLRSEGPLSAGVPPVTVST